eukprot:TRINITY_DN4322_c0_g3_i1.p2 TRINITY_DN4322_c0_g3~~TRINITY_DN4322_c0_g3_i1.p2  ORF type:complete len:126 (+),score=7.21 TRINITY_DN4322_c0_g3_i1:90-467(+)
MKDNPVNRQIQAPQQDFREQTYTVADRTFLLVQTVYYLLEFSVFRGGREGFSGDQNEAWNQFSLALETYFPHKYCRESIAFLRRLVDEWPDKKIDARADLFPTWSIGHFFPPSASDVKKTECREC